MHNLTTTHFNSMNWRFEYLPLAKASKYPEVASKSMNFVGEMDPKSVGRHADTNTYRCTADTEDQSIPRRHHSDGGQAITRIIDAVRTPTP